MISRLVGGVKLAALLLAILLVVIGAALNPEGAVHVAKAVIGGVAHGAERTWAWGARVIHSI